MAKPTVAKLHGEAHAELDKLNIPREFEEGAYTLAERIALLAEVTTSTTRPENEQRLVEELRVAVEERDQARERAAKLEELLYTAHEFVSTVTAWDGQEEDAVEVLQAIDDALPNPEPEAESA